MMKSIDETQFKVMLPQSAHAQAQKFYQLHEDSHKAQQVYLNTLAVYAVNFYLNCLGIETDIIAGDSWNPVMQTLVDSADLIVKNIGKIECRPVLPKDKLCHISPEVWQERIGYVAVQFNPELTEATLLGCLKNVINKSAFIEQLQPLENLIGCLDQPHYNRVNLRQWFEQIFELNWQNLENFINADTQKILAVRQTNLSSKAETSLEIEGQNSIAGAKLIDWGIQLGKQAVFLVITLIPETEEKLGVQVQLYPLAGHSYLPSGIELTLLSESEETLAKVQARLSDNFIQLPYFKGKLGEAFAVKVTLNNVIIVENFTF